MAVLALHYIQKHGFKEPTHFISELNNTVFDIIGNDPLIILDDVSYSGSQLSTILGNIYFNRVVKDNKAVPNIFVLLIALNDFSKAKLSTVPKEKVRSGIIMRYTVSPFKLIFLPERLYTPLLIKLAIERYFYLNLFFSPYTGSTPYVSLYLDHKIADEASTYKNVLLYGPIVPSNYDYNKFVVYIDYLFEIMPSESLFNEEQIQNLYADFNAANNTSFKKITYEVVKHLCNKLLNIDTYNPNSLLDNNFKPFINGCNKNPILLENISDPSIIHFDYSLLMAPNGCIEENKECVITNEGIVEYFDEYFNDKDVTLTKSQAVQISNKINSFVCPSSWYKKGVFQMTCISE